MRRMYSESQLKRLIEENGTKLYRHAIRFKETTYLYIIDITLISGRAEAYASCAEALKDNAGVTVAALLNAGGAYYGGSLSTVGVTSGVLAYLVTSMSVHCVSLTTVSTFTDTVSPL